MTNFIFIHDIVGANGKTIKEHNLEMQHKIDVGQLVELESGTRLFVYRHNRDCDGTPLYVLTWRKTIEESDEWDLHGGFSEESIKEAK